MKKAIVVVGVALSCAVTLSACRAAEQSFGVGDKVKDFKLKTPKGTAVPTAKFREGKVFLLKFGATWCGWCNKQVPHLNKVAEEYGKKVAVLDVDIKEGADRVRAHNKKLGAKFVTVLDTKGIVAGKYGVRGIPLVIIADQDGKIVYRGNYTPFQNFKKQIDPLLKGEEEKKAG
ncbi:MAG: TlpA family protein disulfide reductase [Planctomycetota bacterium]